jgi:hypothetical protein
MSVGELQHQQDFVVRRDRLLDLGSDGGVRQELAARVTRADRKRPPKFRLSRRCGTLTPRCSALSLTSATPLPRKPATSANDIPRRSASVRKNRSCLHHDALEDINPALGETRLPVFSYGIGRTAFHPPIRHGSHHGDELISINAVNVVEER